MKAMQDLYGVFDIDILEVSLKITQYLLADLRTLKKINACLKIDPSLPLVWYFCYFVTFQDLYATFWHHLVTFWYQEKLLNFWNLRLGMVEERGFPLKNFDDSSTYFSEFGMAYVLYSFFPLEKTFFKTL